MKYFKHIKPTVGSRLVEATEPIISDEQRLQSMFENHRVMQKGKLGQVFSPLTRFQTRDLAQLTNNKKSWH
jgi:hypothetical protein